MVKESQPIEVRLARIDERLAFQAKRADERHAELIKKLDPLVITVHKHDVKLAVHAQKWKWLYGIAAFVGGAAGVIAKYAF